MNDWLTGWRTVDRVAIALAGVCLLVLGSLWFLDGRFSSAAMVVPAMETQPAPALDSASVNVNLDYQALANRPLFIDTRRPYVPPSVATPAQPAAPPEPMALLATVMSGTTHLALIQLQRDNRTQKVAVGEAIAGWTLTEVQSGFVTLTRSTESRRLELVVKAGIAPVREPSPPGEQ